MKVFKRVKFMILLILVSISLVNPNQGKAGSSGGLPDIEVDLGCGLEMYVIPFPYFSPDGFRKLVRLPGMPPVMPPVAPAVAPLADPMAPPAPIAAPIAFPIGKKGGKLIGDEKPQEQINCQEGTIAVQIPVSPEAQATEAEANLNMNGKIEHETVCLRVPPTNYIPESNDTTIHHEVTGMAKEYCNCGEHAEFPQVTVAQNLNMENNQANPTICTKCGKEISDIQHHFYDEATGKVHVAPGCQHNYHKVIDSHKISAGIGVFMGIPFDFGIGEAAGVPVAEVLPLCVIGGSILPIIGEKIKSVRKFDNYDDARSAHKMRPPKKAGDLDKWNVGDKIIYSRFAILTVDAGVFVMGAGATAGTKFSGVWRNTVEKLDENRVKLTIGKRVLFGVKPGKLGWMFFVKAMKEYEKYWERDISFIYDFRSEDARSAFTKAIWGLTIPSYHKSKENIPEEEKEVRLVLKENTEGSKDYLPRFYARLPILMKYRFEKFHKKEYQASVDYDEKTKTNTHAFSFEKAHKYKRINNPLKFKNWLYFQFKHVNRTNTAQGAAFHVKSIDPQLHETISRNGGDQGYGIRINWHYSNTNARKHTAHDVNDKLRKHTGYMDKTDVVFPETHHDMGHVEIDYTLVMGTESIKSIVKNLDEDTDYLNKISAEVIKDYLLNERENSDHLCIRSKTGELKVDCYEKLVKKTNNRLKKISKRLNRAVYQDSNDRKRSLDLAKAGRTIMRHPLLFRTMTRADSRVKATFRVRGEQFLPYEVEL